MSEKFDPYHTWLGIPPQQQPANHYRLLGIELFEGNGDVIESAADQRMAHLRSFQTGKHTAESQRLLNEVAAAKVCLLDLKKKGEYDAKLQETLVERPAPDASEQSFSEIADVVASAQATTEPRQCGRHSSGGGGRLWVFAGSVAVIGALVAALLAWRAYSRPESASETVNVASRGENSGQPPQVKAEKAALSDSVGPRGGKGNEAKQGESAMPLSQAPENPAELPKSEGSAVSAQSRPGQADESTAKSEGKAEPTPTKVETKEPAQPEAPPAPQPAQPEAHGPRPDTEKHEKLPVPDEAALEQAAKLARQVFGPEFEGAATSSAKQAVAKKILSKAVETPDDPPARFVMLRLAKDIAVGINDPEVAFEAIDRMAETFAVDRGAMRSEALAGLAKRAKTPEEHRWLAQRALAFSQESLTQDNLAAAEQFGKLSLAEASKSRDKETLQQVRAANKELKVAQKGTAEIEAAKATLRENPEDPEANLTLGRHLCFVKGDWEKGLPLLARGSDAGLKELAQQEVTSPPQQPDEQIKLADAWWEKSQQAPPKTKAGMMLRAGYWYQQAGEIPSALLRTQVENRLAEIAKLGRDIPEAPASKVWPSDPNGWPIAFQNALTSSDGYANLHYSVGTYSAGVTINPAEGMRANGEHSATAVWVLRPLSTRYLASCRVLFGKGGFVCLWLSGPGHGNAIQMGYCCILDMSGNGRLDRDGKTVVSFRMPQPLDLSKFHDLSALRDQDRVKVSMDGAVLAEYKDPQPLSGPLNCRFGFGSKGTHTFRELKIRAVPLAAEAAKALAEMPLRPAATVPPRRNTRRLFAITGRGICSSGDWLCTQPQHLHPIYNAVVLNGPNSAPSLFYKQPVSGDLAFEVVMEYAPRVYRPSSVKGPDFPLPYLRDGGGEAGFVMYVGLDSKRPDSKRIAEQGFPAGWEVCLPHRDGLIVISWFKGRCHASTPYYAPIGGSKYNVRLERRGDTLRLFFDGRAVLEAKQPENVPTGDYSTILGFHQDLEGVIVHSASAYLID